MPQTADAPRSVTAQLPLSYINARQICELTVDASIVWRSRSFAQVPVSRCSERKTFFKCAHRLFTTMQLDGAVRGCRSPSSFSLHPVVGVDSGPLPPVWPHRVRYNKITAIRLVYRMACILIVRKFGRWSESLIGVCSALQSLAKRFNWLVEKLENFKFWAPNFS